MNEEILAGEECSYDMHPFERPFITQEQAKSGKYPCVCNGSCEATFWCMYSTEEEGIIKLSDFPYPYPDDSVFDDSKIMPEHCVDFEIQNIGFEDLFLIYSNYKYDDIYNKYEKWLQENNLKPDIPFQIKATVTYEKISTLDGVEYDSYCDYEILEQKENSNE